MNEIYWIWLSLLPGVGPIFQKRLVEYFSSPENVFAADEHDLYNNISGINNIMVKSIIENQTLDKAKCIKEQCDKQKIKILTINNQNYCKIAKVCPESPVVLYYKGNIKQIKDSVAIVGSRRCSDYGRKITQQIAAEISKQGIAIISGMAKGIDGYAHTTAIKSNGYTLAFLANSVEKCYPSEHLPLYEQIIENGAVLSEYPPGTKAHPKYFLKRNALISAWSDKVIIVEPGEKSGALTTANFAQKYKREIFAVPNRIDEPSSKGTNLLLETIAKPYVGLHSIKLKNINKIQQKSSTKIAKIKQKEVLCPIESKLLNLIRNKPKQIYEARSILDISKNEMEELLFNLELLGKIKIQGENIFIKNHKK